MPEKGGIRAFLAIPSDGLWVESARGLLARLEPSLPRASWTKPSSWHLTLKFFERIPPEPVTAFGAAIGRVAAELVPGEMRSGGAVVFPARGPARVLGVGFAPSPALDEVSRLAREAEEQARALGLPEEKRAFHPHVTLARLRSSWPDEAVETFRREVEAWSFPAWQARACVLYESRLLPEGAAHTPLEEWSFIGGPRGVRA
jgi:RNA 2',3'-cyclic 3'-phosphodiesterase